MNIDKIKPLVELDTPNVANGLGRLGVRDPSAGYTGPDVRALLPELGARVGVAVTARLDTTSPGTDNPPTLMADWLRLIREAAHSAGTESMPVFAVIEAVGPRPRHCVVLGDGMATILKIAGATAFLTNGSIRDLPGVQEVPLACWAAGLSPMHGRMRWLDVNNPVVIDGMTVRPGDIIHADVNGAVVLPHDVADQVYDAALAEREREAALFAKWRAPDMTLDSYLEYLASRPLQPSRAS